jgi:hypothetical protein
MIDPKAEPLFNRSPYKRVDLARRQRPEVITREDYENGVIPDEALYEYWVGDQVWRLKK